MGELGGSIRKEAIADPWAAFPIVDTSPDPWAAFPLAEPDGSRATPSQPSPEPRTVDAGGTTTRDCPCAETGSGAAATPATPAATTGKGIVDPKLLVWDRGGQDALGKPPATTTPAAPKVSLSDALLDVPASAASGLRKGITNLVGLPVGAANWALSKVPGLGDYLSSDAPIGGAASLDNAARLGGLVPQYTPQTGVGRFVDRAAQDVGAAMVPVTAGAAITRALGSEGVRALQSFQASNPGTWLPGVAKSLGAPMVAAPVRTAVKELSTSAGAGAGAAAANQIFGPDNWVAELLGGIGGASATAIGRGIASHIGTVGAAVTGSPKYASRVVNENVADTLASNSDIVARQAANAPPGIGMNTDPLVSALRESALVESAVPGFRATAANRTGDAGLGALEAARARGPNQGRFTDAAGANNTAVERAVGEVAPTQPSAALSDAMQAERTHRISDADALAQMFGKEADTASAPLVVNTTRAERGGAIREDLTAARDAARGKTDAAYSDLRNGAGFADAQGSGANLQAAVNDARDTLTETRKGLLPESTINRVLAIAKPDAAPSAGILDASGNPIARPPTDKAVDLTEVVDLDSELSRLQRAAAADPRAEKGGRNAAEAIGRVRTSLDDYLQGAMTPSQRDEQQQCAHQTADRTPARVRRRDKFVQFRLAQSAPVTGRGGFDSRRLLLVLLRHIVPLSAPPWGGCAYCFFRVSDGSVPPPELSCHG